MKPYFECEHGVLYHGDCLEIMPELPKVDLVLTDPPYGIGISKNPIRQKHDKKEWDTSTPSQEVIDCILAKSTNQIIWGGNYFNLPPSRCFIVWDKVQPENFSLAMAEMAWTSFNENAKIFRESARKEKKIYHPTQKSALLFQWCVDNYSKDAAIILDPFAGSGTTALACINTQRKFILIEKEKAYCDIIVKRLEQHLSQTTLLDFC